MTSPVASRDGLHRAAVLVSGIFGVLVLLLVIIDIFANNDDPSWTWRVLTAVSAVVLLVGARMFNTAPGSALAYVVTVIGLLACGFLTFWTFASILVAVIGLVLVSMVFFRTRRTVV